MGLERAREDMLDVLALLIPADDHRVSPEQMDEIAHELVRVGRLHDVRPFDLFWDLDTFPGRFPTWMGVEWHWKLRQARNGGAAFFDILAGKVVRQP